MKTNHKLALAVLAGASIGVAGVGVIHADQPETPPAYLIAEVDVTNPAGVQNYAEKVRQTLALFDGHYRYLVRGGTTQAARGRTAKAHRGDCFRQRRESARLV